MKKGLLVLSTLLLLSCVNLNNFKNQKVINDTKNSGTKSNIVNTQKVNKKKNISATNNVKAAKINKPFFIIPLPFLFKIVR